LIASIRRLNKAGLSILLVSHDMELMAVAETVYVLNFGEILANGSMAAIQQDANVREVYLGV
jgi:branched-chain amino acid transport system ATP-binding protein